MIQSIRFSDLVEINPKVELIRGEEYPFIDMAIVEPGRRYVRAIELRKYSGGGSKFSYGDVLFARITPCLENGKIVQFRDNDKRCGFGSTEFFIFRAKNQISDSAFIYYLVLTDSIRKPAEKSMSGASGRQRADLTSIIDIEVPRFSLHSQQKIAGILSAYDDLIDVNTQRIRILEEMMQAIFHEWFVNFHFPGHKDVRMVKSELGPLPDGWEIKKISEICASISDGDWIETKDQGGEDYRLLQVSNIGIGEFIETGNFRYITKETFERLHCLEILPEDILISRMPKPTGRAWLVTEQEWKMITAVDVAVIKTDTTLAHPQFLVNHLNSPAQLDLVEKHTTGTTRPRISRSALSNLNLCLPPIEIQNLFGTISDTLYTEMVSLRKMNINLGRTRDLLLPKLISGEIDVSKLDIRIPEAES